jgi:hypothetical protein
MEATDQLDAPSLYPPVPIEQEAWWDCGHFEEGKTFSYPYRPSCFLPAAFVEGVGIICC